MAITLVLKGGTLRKAVEGEFRNKKKGKKGEDDEAEGEIDVSFYTSRTIDGEYEVIDLDKTSAMPLARSILGQIGLYPELKIVKMIRNVLLVVFLLLLWVFTRTSDLQKGVDFEKGKKEIIDKIANSCTVSKNPFGSGSISRELQGPVDTKTTTATGTKQPIFNFLQGVQK